MRELSVAGREVEDPQDVGWLSRECRQRPTGDKGGSRSRSPGGGGRELEKRAGEEGIAEKFVTTTRVHPNPRQDETPGGVTGERGLPGWGAWG